MFIPDNRNGLSESVSIELQTESTRSIGVDSNGRERTIFFSNVPQIIIKTTYTVVGTESDWTQLINTIDSKYKSITTIPTGKFIESANTGGGWYIIDGTDYYSGTYTEVDYSNLKIGSPGTEFKVILNESTNVSPTGYLPSGEAFFSNSITGKRFNRSSVSTFESAKKIEIGKSSSTHGGYIISKNLSNPRLINDIEYVDLSLELIELKATVGIF